MLIFTTIGLLEIYSGIISGSVGLISDGGHTLSDAVVSAIVWMGLRVIGRAPDGKIHFDSYKAENFTTIISAFVMVVVGIFILLRSVAAFLEPIEITNPTIPLVVSGLASITFWTLGFYKLRVSKVEDTTSVKLDAYNTMKSGLSSLLAFVGILLSSFFLQTDALAGIAISAFIFLVAYLSVRESAMVLVDACECPSTTATITSAIGSIEGIKEVRAIHLRPSGGQVRGELKIRVGGKKTVKEANSLVEKTKTAVNDIVPDLVGLTVEVEA